MDRLATRNASISLGTGGPQGRHGMSADMTVRVDDHELGTVITVAGEIDVYTAPRLRDVLVNLVSDGRYRLVVDLDDVTFMDSTALGVLVGGLKRVKVHDGSLDLVCGQEQILKIFRITGLTKVFPIHPALSDALASAD
jgi:anti-sigma B factor antagonist